MKRIVTIAVCFFMMGCANTNFKMALVDLDMRSPEQIEAMVPEAEIVFKETNLLEPSAPEDVISTQSLPTEVWTAIMEAVKVIKIRIRVLPIEYSHTEAK